MPFSFEESEYSEQADAALESLEGADSRGDNVEDEELFDVDLRLETADYYRAILNHDFFDVQSQAAEIVDREVRAFIRERLEVLLGLRAPKEQEAAPSPFSDDEVQALKTIAAKVLGKPSLIAASAPVVKKMPTPVPAPKPQAKPILKPKPQARKVPAPPPAPSTKPKPKAKPPVLAKAEAKDSGAEEKPAPKPKGESQTFISHEGEQVTLTEGEVINENGRRYVVARNDNGTLYRKDITGQVVPASRLPAMSPQQLSIASQQMAERQLDSLDQLTGLAVVASIRSKSE